MGSLPQNDEEFLKRCFLPNEEDGQTRFIGFYLGKELPFLPEGELQNLSWCNVRRHVRS
jgi:hypothetical protein